MLLKLSCALIVLAQELTPAQKHSGFKGDERSWKDSVVINRAWQSKSNLNAVNAAKYPFFDQLRSLESVHSLVCSG